MVRQFVDGWKYIGGTPLVRGLVLGIFGAFAGGGIVIGTARFFTASLGAGDAAFYLLFATLFIGLAIGIGLGPMIVRDLSRRRWFGMSIVLASGSVMFLSVAFHLSMALLGALLVGAGAGMAFLAGTTLLGGEVSDEVRGRVFAVVQIGTRLVLLLAISLSGVLVGLGSSRRARDRPRSASTISSTRLLLLVAGVVGVWTGISAFRQMDDKRGVPVLADLWGSIRGRPAVAGRAVRPARRLRGLRGRRGRRQVHPGHPRWRRRCGPRAATSWSPASRARPTSGARIRGLVLGQGRRRRRRRGPRRCSTPPTAPTTWPPSYARPWPAARW